MEELFDTYRFVRMKAEAIASAARGVGLDIIMEMADERAYKRQCKWLSVAGGVTGFRGNRSRRGQERAKLRGRRRSEREEIYRCHRRRALWAELL